MSLFIGIVLSIAFKVHLTAGTEQYKIKARAILNSVCRPCDSIFISHHSLHQFPSPNSEQLLWLSHLV